MSVKQIQSELGLVGDVSPNLEIMYNASTVLHDKFDKDSNGLAEHDAYLFISQAFAGNPVGETENTGMAVNANIAGGGKEVFHMLVKIMEHDEKIEDLFQKAVVTVLLRKLKNHIEKEGGDDDGPQDELLRKLMNPDN